MTRNIDIPALSVDELSRPCIVEQFSFKTTAELDDLAGLIGQDRAIEALHFGIGIQQQGYNLFVLGPPGIGKYTMVRQYLENQAADRPPPSDWCYVNNFDKGHKPCVVELPAGKGREFRQDMMQLVEDLRTAIPLAFEAREYQSRVREIEDDFKKRRNETISAIADEAEQHHIAMIRTPEGFVFAAKTDGHVLKPEDFEKLSEQEQKRIEELITRLRDSLSNAFLKFSQWQREGREKIRAVNREVAMFAVGHQIHELKQKYEGVNGVNDYLGDVEQDVIDNLNDFVNPSDSTDGPALKGSEEDIVSDASFRRYRVNLFVDNSELKGAPVIYEDSPLHQNLVGRAEYLAQMGTLLTDFMLIRPGALHLANGGYLILDAHKLLLQPYAWQGLKRALFSREVRIESLGQIYSLVNTVSLEPQPIPIDLKVVLLGDRLLYYLLQAYDDEFPELFKVAADFEESMARSEDNILLYARMIATLVRKENLLAFDRDAVARVIDYSARQVGDALKLTTHMLSVADLLREADYWARSMGHEQVQRDDVQHAIDKQIYRHDRLRTQMQEQIKRGTVLIDTRGEHIGQVNGLFIIDLGQYSFAQPGRITATTRLGEGEVIDIEREVELGGAIHSKGMLILSSFIGARYGQQRPLSMTASLVFEQTYGPVEGDSASVAECCALLSSLAALPVKQSLAVTGSVNQHGQVQAIGGVNEKIEGFFDVCRDSGLTGDQGVIIPRANVEHLMLRQDVIDAVTENRFRIYAVTRVDEAVQLLTGMVAGERDEEGHYPDDSVNGRIDARLGEMAEIKQAFAHSPEKEDERETSKEEME